MSDWAIRANGLSKRYRIRQTTVNDSLKESLMGVFRGPSKNGSPDTYVWALRDVGFEVQAGEVVGLLGRNGAGKSTLLKILSRITVPTSGWAQFRGRMSSLLEVGTAFHPDLTGRENIYLNGSILGMTVAEIKRKQDEIIEFAEIETFIDTPVKRYSSGMYLRLAFSVAAHLEPEILLVDEVLAVGDVNFQKKCMGKMGDVASSGRTILFVSHNMAAIRSLCSRALLIENGQVAMDDKPLPTIARYMDKEARNPSAFHVNTQALESTRDAPVAFTGLDLLDGDRGPCVALKSGDPLVLRIRYRAARRFLSPCFHVTFKDRYGIEIARVGCYGIEALEGEGYLDLSVDRLPLTGGRYHIDLEFGRGGIGIPLRLEEVVSFDVEAHDCYDSGIPTDDMRGIVLLPHTWSHSPAAVPLQPRP